MDERRLSADKAPLTWWKKLFYGVGHVQNDLCASMWFSYMLLFMHKVVSLNNVNAGYIVLVGQIADGLATPFVGIESDKTRHGKYGRRKKWHLLGWLCVTFSFPFLFNMCIYHCSNSPAYALMIYYVPFIVVFQFGWAAVQISHLALIPEVAHSEQGKVELNAIRYFFTVMSNLLVFVICFVLFATDSSGQEIELSRRDAPKFQILGIGVVLVGAVFMIIFHCGVKEEEVNDVTVREDYEASSEFNRENNKTIGMWFRTPLFYQVGGLYMLTRLIVNVTQIYVSYFVLDSLQLTKNAIAIAPAVIYISGIIASLIAKRLNAKLGLKWTFFFGCCLIYGSSAWFYVLKSLSMKNRYEVYGACVLLGMGGSTLLINALAIISEMIGKNTGTSAFVFGAMSFLDKVSNGGAVIIIQYLHPCKNSAFCCPACQEYYRLIMSVVPGGLAVLALILLLTLAKTHIGARPKTDKRFGGIDSVSRDNLIPSPEPEKPKLQEPNGISS